MFTFKFFLTVVRVLIVRETRWYLSGNRTSWMGKRGRERAISCVFLSTSLCCCCVLCEEHFFYVRYGSTFKRKKIHLNNLYSVEKGNNVRDYSVKSINYFFYLVFSHNHFFHRVLFFWSYVNEAKNSQFFSLIKTTWWEKRPKL